MMRIKSFWIIVERIIYNVLSFFCHSCGRQLSEKAFVAFMQFFKFGIIGVSNTFISYVLYSGGLILLRKFHLFHQVDYLIAQLVAFAVSVLWSFYWNNRLVFTLEDGGRRSVWKALAKTYISYSFTGLFLNSILLLVWVRVLHISEFIAPIINLVITVPLNFLMNKLWAFKQG